MLLNFVCNHSYLIYCIPALWYMIFCDSLLDFYLHCPISSFQIFSLHKILFEMEPKCLFFEKQRKKNILKNSKAKQKNSFQIKQIDWFHVFKLLSIMIKFFPKSFFFHSKSYFLNFLRILYKILSFYLIYLIYRNPSIFYYFYNFIPQQY